MTTYTVEKESVGERLDVFLAACYPDLSRAFIQRLIEQENVLVGDHVERASYKLRENDRVVVQFNQDELMQIPDIELPVLYEDDDCIVINKPTGVLTHSKGAFNPEATVATFISSRVHGMSGDRAGIVHRLDRATSGVIICAKHPEALSWLQKQFSQRKVKKVYYAVITGTLKPEKAMIDMPIERHPKRPQTFRVGSNGKQAVTEYEVTTSNETHSLITLRPTTGRTHQLRVHLAKLNHPILGDTLYGGEEADRLYLHAHSLEITLPTRERKVFTAQIPEEFSIIVQ